MVAVPGAKSGEQFDRIMVLRRRAVARIDFHWRSGEGAFGVADRQVLVRRRDGTPAYNVGADGKVDWFTFSGYVRYSSECLRCHGPDGMGSTEGPALKDSLKTMNYATFTATVAQGKKDLGAGQEKVTPSLGTDKNVMCCIDDIYVYLKARADDAVPRERPKSNEPEPKSARDAANTCMGPE